MKPYTIEDYDITREGQIINKHSGRVLKGQLNNKGYYRVSIGGHLEFIHRLVAQKYVPNPENKEQVNHINGIKTDNRVENLEWVTNQENRNHAINNNLQIMGEQCSYAKLKEEDIKFIRENYQKINTELLANLFNVSSSNIRTIANYYSWKHI